MIPLIEKYRPKNFSEIKGQDLAITEIKNFIKIFPKKRALILNSPAGMGKTSLVLATAKEFNLELFELNSSDLRNRKKLEEILKPAIEQRSLFKKGKLILMDEADGITASDRGGLPELLTLIDKTSFPIIITANDIWQKKFSQLRRKCKIISLKELKPETIKEILKNILEKENKTLNQETIEIISKSAKGDVRASINDLQTALTIGEEEFISETHKREKEETIFNALKKIFQEPTNQETIKIYDNLNQDLDEILLWVEENIPLEYKGEPLARAYDSLSKADLFRGRIYKQQYWRFLVYQNFFLSVGVSSATRLKYKKFTQYKKPSRILKIWLSNQKSIKKKSIISKYAKFSHMSKKKAMKEFFLLPLILNQQTQIKLDLDEKEQEYLKNKKSTIILSNNLNKLRV